MSEADAHQTLLKLAMDQGKKVGEEACNVIAIMELLSSITRPDTRKAQTHIFYLVFAALANKRVSHHPNARRRNADVTALQQGKKVGKIARQY
jgi:hypothetical protein